MEIVEIKKSEQVMVSITHILQRISDPVVFVQLEKPKLLEVKVDQSIGRLSSIQSVGSFEDESA